MRAAPLTILLMLAGCGGSETSDGTDSDMPARTWKYYAANPAEIGPMQEICRRWAGSNTPTSAQPAVVTTNCRAAAFAKSQLQLTQ
jgi:ABC-type glycerol-3-phosphate transport system substrate-binding protein